MELQSSHETVITVINPFCYCFIFKLNNPTTNVVVSIFVQGIYHSQGAFALKSKMNYKPSSSGLVDNNNVQICTGSMIM